MTAQEIAQTVFVGIFVFVVAAAVGIPQFVAAVIQELRGKP